MKFKQGTGVAICIAVLLIALGLIPQYYAVLKKKNPANLNQIVIDSDGNLAGENILHEEVVQYTINSSLGAFAESKWRIYGIPFGRKVHYAIMLEDNSILVVEVKKKSDIALLDKISKETYESKDLVANTKLPVQGKVHQITDHDLKKYYDEGLQSIGITGEKEGNIKIRYLAIDASVNRSHVMTIIIIMVFASITGIVLEIVLSRDKKEYEQAVKRANIEEAERIEKAERAEMMANSSVNALSNNEFYSDDSLSAFGIKAADDSNVFNPSTDNRTEDNKISISGRDLLI